MRYVITVYEQDDITSNMEPLAPPTRSYREDALSPEDAVMQVANDLAEIEAS
jgi:hypothetical protein